MSTNPWHHCLWGDKDKYKDTPIPYFQPLNPDTFVLGPTADEGKGRVEFSPTRCFGSSEKGAFYLDPQIPRIEDLEKQFKEKTIQFFFQWETTLIAIVSSSQKSICSHLFFVSATPLSPAAPRPHHQELVAGILMEETRPGDFLPLPQPLHICTKYPPKLLSRDQFNKWNVEWDGRQWSGFIPLPSIKVAIFSKYSWNISQLEFAGEVFERQFEGIWRGPIWYLSTPLLCGDDDRNSYYQGAQRRRVWRLPKLKTTFPGST